jgi:hypothetical protein
MRAFAAGGAEGGEDVRAGGGLLARRVRALRVDDLSDERRHQVVQARGGVADCFDELHARVRDDALPVAARLAHDGRAHDFAHVRDVGRLPAERELEALSGLHLAVMLEERAGHPDVEDERVRAVDRAEDRLGELEALELAPVVRGQHGMERYQRDRAEG